MKEKEKRAEGEETTIESIFEILEERIEKLSARVADMTAENGRLKKDLEALSGERDELKATLEESKASAGKTQSDLAERLAKFEAERNSLRGRIEKLVKSLEETETP
jgi:peptidoglycan hydrolase CwlO-like protein